MMTSELHACRGLKGKPYGRGVSPPVQTQWSYPGKLRHFSPIRIPLPQLSKAKDAD